MCSGSTAYTSIKESGLRPGQWAVFPGGGGGVGMQAVQLAIAMGLRAVVIDTGAERKEACLKFGADEFIDFKEVENPVDRVVELTGGGAHAVFVTGKCSDLGEGFMLMLRYSRSVISHCTRLPRKQSRSSSHVYRSTSRWKVQHGGQPVNTCLPQSVHQGHARRWHG
jgi:D-arabinose 1-dehydrogenase-like Zn-dependent alcohol dehydrogenase